MQSSTALLQRVLNPQSVAVIGASADRGKFGGRVLHFLVKHRYGGRIVPVTRSGGELLGIPAYPRITDAPGEIDIAIAALPAAHLPQALEECGAAGVRCCVIITSDFAEAGVEGAARQDELVQIARRHGMRLIGPNCLGLINPRLNLALTSSIALAVEPMPNGPIGLVSQSGSLMATMISHAQDLGTGFTIAASVGNQADLELCDFLEYLIADETTRAICLYVEGLKDAQRFLALAERCRNIGKPLLAVKAGRSETGMRITQSHTASLAGSYAVWEAACRAHAVCVLDDPEGMIQCAHFLVRFGAPAGDAVAAMSASGGTIAVMCDRIAAAGLRLAELASETQRTLSEWFPPPRLLNPLDTGGLPTDKGMAGAMLAYEALARDPNVGVVVNAVATTPQLEDKVQRWGELALEIGKPTAILLAPGTLVEGARASLRRIGCPFTNRMDDTLRVVRTAIEYGEALRDRPEALATPDYAHEVAARVTRLPADRLTEPEVKELLRICGVATTPDVVAENAERAIEAAESIGYPVVLKAVSRDLVHKSDIGAVRLGLESADHVRRAWAHIADAVSTHLPHARLDGCVVQPMVRSESAVEMLVGARRDAQFGAVIVVGSGGVLVELFRDVQLALAPVSAQTARDMVQRLRLAPLLAGTRGRPALDTEAVVETIVRVGWMAAALGSRLIELDINPLLVKPRGEGAIALDGRATLA